LFSDPPNAQVVGRRQVVIFGGDGSKSGVLCADESLCLSHLRAQAEISKAVALLDSRANLAELKAQIAEARAPENMPNFVFSLVGPSRGDNRGGGFLSSLKGVCHG
jgi:hypothetical protein